MQQFYISKNTPKIPSHKHWQFCVGSCHAALMLRRDYTEQLKQTHDDLGIQQVRFHGIFHDDMHTYDTLADALGDSSDQIPKLYYKNFRYPGLAYDNVLAAGMKPFVELSFMPKALAKNPDARGTFYYKPCISMPKDDAQWQDYIQSFVRYLIDRYGKEEVESWYFEVWNEPDLTTPFFAGTQEDYFHLYEITALAVKAVDPNLKVGGPSTSASKWIGSFVKFCHEKNLPLDFITTHQYTGDPISSVYDQGGQSSGELSETERAQMEQYQNIDLAALFAGLKPEEGFLPFYRRILPDTTETEDLDRDILAHNAAVVHKQAPGLPVYYTEWNVCATHSAPGNDTRKAAAYQVRSALATDGIIDGSSIWCFTDIFEEGIPYPEEFHGGFGLMTQSGIKKPAYRALQMLAQTGSERYDLPDALDGEVSIAAFCKEDQTQLVLIRQSLTHFTEADPAPVEIKLELETAPAAVTLHRIDETHCNPYAAWQKMGSPMDITPDIKQDLEAASVMQPESLPVDYQNGVLTIRAELGINDVYFVTVK